MPHPAAAADRTLPADAEPDRSQDTKPDAASFTGASAAPPTPGPATAPTEQDVTAAELPPTAFPLEAATELPLPLTTAKARPLGFRAGSTPALGRPRTSEESFFDDLPSPHASTPTDSRGAAVFPSPVDGRDAVEEQPQFAEAREEPELTWDPVRGFERSRDEDGARPVEQGDPVPVVEVDAETDRPAITSSNPRAEPERVPADAGTPVVAPLTGTPDGSAVHAGRGYVDPVAVARFGRVTGVDLGFVPVSRTPAASAGAAQLGAHAFTAAGVVHLPEELGPMDRSDTQAVLGHELTHVLHQRTFGHTAREDAPLGQALEAQAQAVERSFRGEPAAADSPGAWQRPRGVEDEPTYLTWTPDTGFVDPPDTAHDATVTAAAPVQRAPIVVAGPNEDQGGPAPEPVVQPAADEPQPLRYPDTQWHADGQGEQRLDGRLDQTALELSDADISRIAERLPTGVVTPQLDLRDPGMLDALATGLYARLRSRLRSELITDRERAGRLTEFH